MHLEAHIMQDRDYYIYSTQAASSGTASSDIRKLAVRTKQSSGRKKSLTVKTPRSRGCRICVERRIKCDQARPFCQKCVRAKRECPGFSTINIVDEGPNLRAAYNVLESGSVSWASSSTSPEQDHLVGNLKRPTTPSLESKENAEVDLNYYAWNSKAPSWPAPAAILAPTLIQDQLFSNLVDSVSGPSLSAISSHGTWLAQVARKPERSNALTEAMRALSLSHAGRTTKDTAWIKKSRSLYGKALYNLNTALQDSGEGLTSDTLSATLLLSFYEIFDCTSGFSWVQHAGGAGKLIRLRGPERHRTGFDREVFLACRYFILLEASQRRQPCFLGEPGWRQLLHDIRTDQGPSKLDNTDEDFFEEIVVCPEIFHDSYKVIADPNASQGDISKVYSQSIASRAEIRNAHRRMSKFVAGTETEIVKCISSTKDEVFPNKYEFPDISIAWLFCTYLTVMCAMDVCIMGLEAKLAGLYHPSSPTNRGDPLLPFDPLGTTPPRVLLNEWGAAWDAAYKLGNEHGCLAEMATYAREICQSVDYLSRAPFLGPLFLIFSLRMALRMPISRREKTWILEKLEDASQTMGLAGTEVQRYHVQQAEGFGVEWKAATDGDDEEKRWLPIDPTLQSTAPPSLDRQFS